MKKLVLILFAMGLFTMTLSSCRNNKSAGDKIEDAADDVADDIQDAVN